MRDRRRLTVQHSDQEQISDLQTPNPNHPAHHQTTLEDINQQVVTERQKSFNFAVSDPAHCAKKTDQTNHLRASIAHAQSHLRSNTMHSHILKKQQNEAAAHAGDDPPSQYHGPSFGQILSMNMDEVKLIKEASAINNKNTPPRKMSANILLNDKEKLLAHYSSDHHIIETKSPDREQTRRLSVDRRRNSLSFAKEDMVQSPKEVTIGRQINLRPEGGTPSDAPVEPSDTPAEPSKLMKNMIKLKKHVKMIGKASLLLNMMKPSMITHKKGVKVSSETE